MENALIYMFTPGQSQIHHQNHVLYFPCAFIPTLSFFCKRKVELCAIGSGERYWSTTGSCPVSFRLHSLHVVLSVQHLQECFDNSFIVGCIHTEDESEVQKAGGGQ